MTDQPMPPDDHPAHAAPPRGRRELKAIAIAVALLLLGDVSVRVVATRLTADAAHVAEIPDLVDPLRDADTGVLFVGNSITRRGIDTGVFTERLPSAAVAVSVHPDDTTIAEWPFLYDHFVESDGIAPDLVIVPFVQGQLRDDRPQQPSRVGGSYSALADLPDRLSDTDGLSGRTELVTAYLLRFYADRERLARRFWDRVPKYRDLAQAINDRGREAADAASAATAATYERLADLASMVESSGGRLVIVAMPTQFGYEIEPSLVSASGDLGVELVDLRDLAGIGEDDFRDSLHLRESGARVLSGELAARIDI